MASSPFSKGGIEYSRIHDIITESFDEEFSRYEQLLNADETVAQSIVLDTGPDRLVNVYAMASTVTNIYLDFSNDNENWFNMFTWTGVTSVSGTYWIAYRYLRLRSDAAGTSGDTISLILASK